MLKVLHVLFGNVIFTSTFTTLTIYTIFYEPTYLYYFYEPTYDWSFEQSVEQSVEQQEKDRVFTAVLASRSADLSLKILADAAAFADAAIQTEMNIDITSETSEGISMYDVAVGIIIVCAAVCMYYMYAKLQADELDELDEDEPVDELVDQTENKIATPIKLHVGNLLFSIKDQDLYSLFQKVVPELSDVKITKQKSGKFRKSQGFAFCYVPTLEDAEILINAYDSSVQWNRKITVSIAKK